MTLSGKKIALFVEKFFEDLELWYPYYRLQEAGAEVVIVGPKVETYHGKYGVPAQAQRAIHKVTVSEFDALIIPGGYSPDHMRRVPAMITFTTEMHRQGKIVATICHGGWMLASAGIVQGKQVTGFFSIKDDLINAGAQWLDQEVVYDNGIITSRTPADLPAFCREIIRALSA
ncbi:MAG: type 1 glutamine amidotransferase domain-containing protein [Pseudomonadota bacterium]|nr:type 1 glutamine amidotransferase domain-containing protein [Pseudomonadota bacterium]